MEIRLDLLIEKVIDQISCDDMRRILVTWLDNNPDKQIVTLSEKDFNKILVTDSYVPKAVPWTYRHGFARECGADSTISDKSTLKDPFEG